MVRRRVRIIEKITGGELVPGSRLPSQRDLARMLGVGRSSVREAINALVVMGYLEPLQGKGTFISGRREEQDFAGPNIGFSGEMIGKGREVITRILHLA